MSHYAEFPHSIKKFRFGKKYDEKHLKQKNLHGSLSFSKSAQKMIKMITPVVRFVPHSQLKF